MKTKTEEPLRLSDFYPHLELGAVCYRNGGNWLWAGFPLKKGAGCLIFKGRASMNPRPVIAETQALRRSVPFSKLEACVHHPVSLEELLQAKIQQQFQILEQPVALEALVQRQYLHLNYSNRMEIETELRERLRSL